MGAAVRPKATILTEARTDSEVFLNFLNFTTPTFDKRNTEEAV